MIEFNNNWQVKPLGEVCEIIGGNPAPKGEDVFIKDGLPFVKMKDVGRYHLTSNLIDIENKVSPETAEQNRLKLIKKGSILLPRSGSVALNHRVILGMDAYMVSHLCALEIKDTRAVYNKFLYYHLTTINFSNITKKTTGLDAITFEDLARVRIPLPPLPIQKQIAEILEKADEAKQKRKEANKLTDEFLQSVFIEIFGDPVKNPKGWEVMKLGEVFDSIRYGTGSPPTYIENGIPFIRATNIKNNSIVENDLVFISKLEADKIKKCELREGDLIIVRSGVNTGDAAVVPKEFDGAYAAYDLIIELKKVHSVFYSFLINSSYGKAIIGPLSRRAGQPHLNAEQLREIEFYFPPLSLQQKFAEIVNKTEALKEKQKQSEQELEKLFQSLMQKAFKGKLVK